MKNWFKKTKTSEAGARFHQAAVACPRGVLAGHFPSGKGPALSGSYLLLSEEIHSWLYSITPGPSLSPAVELSDEVESA